MAANGRGSLLFIDDETAGRSIRLISEVYRVISAATFSQILQN